MAAGHREGRRRTIVDVTPEADMEEAVGPLWSTERTQAALGVTDAEMTAHRSSGTLLGVPTSDDCWFYPLFQFETHGGGVRVRPALVEFFQGLRDADPWATAILAASAADELDGRSPVEWVRDGGDPEVLADYANVLRSESILSRAGRA